MSRRLPPPWAAATLAVSALLAAAAWVWNLALLAGPLAGSVGYIAALGHWSRHALAAHDPVPAGAAAVAAALVAVAGAALLTSRVCDRFGCSISSRWSMASW